MSASAIGYYGASGEERLAESEGAGEGFAAGLCSEWEKTALRAEEYGVRVCLMRLGVVLDKGAGAFQELERPFRFGLANWVGSGQQYLSWIHRSDAVAAIRYLLGDSGASGAWNLTAPEPVTGREFCEAMKRQHRTLLTQAVPGWVLRLVLGEMANELLLNGQRVLPVKLQAAGFQFQADTVEGALHKIYEA